MERPLIMLIDDDTLLIDMLAELLKDAGYDTICCYNGKLAYAAISTELPDMVILDIQLDQADAGLTVLQMMRLNENTETIPTLLCSADGVFLHSKQEQLRPYRCEVIKKPFYITELLAKIESMLL